MSPDSITSRNFQGMVRTVVAYIVMFFVTTVLATTVVVAHVCGLDGDRRVAQWCMQKWARAVCAVAGVTIELHGAENIARGRGVVYASNHVSWYDVFTIADVLPEYTFVAKAELRKVPIFGWGAEHAGVIFMSRENRKSAFEAYERVAERVRGGTSVVVCPEGTRGDDYHLRPFKKGPFVLAIAAGAPVVPVVVHGARGVMPKGTLMIKPGHVHIHLLPEIQTTGLDYERRHELMTRVWTEMAQLLATEYGVGTAELPYATDAAS
jgi:1-acyl-sn-glycerol-3-phosphate acyltransferase